jgi:hypothetical protein
MLIACHTGKHRSGTLSAEGKGNEIRFEIVICSHPSFGWQQKANVFGISDAVATRPNVDKCKYQMWQDQLAAAVSPAMSWPDRLTVQAECFGRSPLSTLHSLFTWQK